MKIKNDNKLILKINYAGLLIALMVVLGQVLRINIANTTIPLFFIPIFLSPYLLNFTFCFLIGFLGHWLVDLTVWGVAFSTSILWEFGTGLLALIIAILWKMKNKDFIKIILILISNCVFFTIIGAIDWFITKNNAIWINQIIIGVILINNISLTIFYFLAKKISKRLIPSFNKQK